MGLLGLGEGANRLTRWHMTAVLSARLSLAMRRIFPEGHLPLRTPLTQECRVTEVQEKLSHPRPRNPVCVWTVSHGGWPAATTGNTTHLIYFITTHSVTHADVPESLRIYRFMFTSIHENNTEHVKWHGDGIREWNGGGGLISMLFCLLATTAFPLEILHLQNVKFLGKAV